MQKHISIYLDFFGYGVDDFIPCEVCGASAVDIHHIDCRGMGGSKTKNTIDNLMALCRKCHTKYGDKKDYIGLLITLHNKRIK